ncbi:MAG: TnpV protein [Deltaproteobacteria bacterium]|jgi:hypothetical protein|nr:TnpV protein [Deltaproteobacteria bacterium]
MDTKQTAAYCRTALADEVAMWAQERRISEYADRHGYSEPAFYRDRGQNGVTLDRPAMNVRMADIKSGIIGAVLVTNISRIARNYTLVSEWLEMLSKYGVDFVTTADGKPTTNAEIAYIRASDHLIPNIALSNPPDAPPLGYYGMRHKAYLREHRPIFYNWLLMSERLYPLCCTVDDAAAMRLRTIPDRNRAHEIIIAELVCN